MTTNKPRSDWEPRDIAKPCKICGAPENEPCVPIFKPDWFVPNRGR